MVGSPDPVPRVLGWLYQRTGSRYPVVFLALELLTAFPIAAATAALFAFYYDGSLSEYLSLAGFVLALTAVSVAIAVYRSARFMRPLRSWIAGDRTRESTARAWSVAIGVPLHLVRRDSALPVVILVIPSTVYSLFVFDLGWVSFLPLFFGALIAAAYASILHYLALEVGMRPLLVEINRTVAPRVRADCAALPLRVRLMATLPLINVITGLTVAALTGGEGANLGVDVLVAVAVAATISLELTVMLSRSVLRPLADLEQATAELARGNYDVVVPVTTGDEIGELAASFNQMVRGLQERERIREAFGTYLDEEVAKHILSESFSEEGEEAEVSVMFCDVREFTRFASGADAREVVERLNQLFDVVVPVISRHGGHVDKFEGDGLMAVFGVPRVYTNHAERAYEAALEIVRRVNHDAEGGELEVGVGINTGRVVAGSVGGGGRLNFSVIGDPVNIAARVESETRVTGDEVLLTAATRDALGEGVELDSRGERELKGVERPIELFAPAPGAVSDPREPADRAPASA